ncbi:MAG: potassium channel protein [Acidimicrobiia bacterium]|nr:potassium channel protein [Acidimicrobiia bacterium]
MKVLGLALSYVSAPLRHRNARPFLGLIAFFVLLVLAYSVIFERLMEREGQEHSFVSAVYWTVVTMTTLGFGDITFQSDLGRLFSMFVLVTGTAMILVLLPFTFIQFVFMPWMDRREQNRAPRRLPKTTSGHLVLTAPGPIEDALIRRADRSGVPYVVIEPSVQEALRLNDAGYRVMVGDLDDPETYRAARLDHAVCLAATRADTTNSNIVFTARDAAPDTPTVATAGSEASVDILELAGANRVLRLGQILGDALSARILGPDARSHEIGCFADLVIAEASAARTTLAGHTLAELNLRASLGVSVLGVWRRGQFEVAGPDTVVDEHSILILAASREQLQRYDEMYARSTREQGSVVIIGGGRVGRAVGRAVHAEGIDYRIIEQLPERVRPRLADRYVVGDAANIDILEAAGIHEASSVVITTHDDDVNVYLALYCRKLRPGIELIARANADRNVSTLYRAGADAVLSYASTGAAAIWNEFRGNDTLLLAEGLDVFRTPVPRALVGRTLADSKIRNLTGCNVVAVSHEGHLEGNPRADEPLPAGGELVLIGDEEAEERFLSRFPP